MKLAYANKEEHEMRSYIRRMISLKVPNTTQNDENTEEILIPNFITYTVTKRDNRYYFTTQKNQSLLKFH